MQRTLVYAKIIIIISANSCETLIADYCCHYYCQMIIIMVM